MSWVQSGFGEIAYLHTAALSKLATHSILESWLMLLTCQTPGPFR